MKTIRVFAPATVANVACGFDVLGFAVDAPGDEVVVRLTDKPGVVIEKITGDNGRLPKDPSRNTAGIAALEFLKKMSAGGTHTGVALEVHKKMPLGSGLGSSAASAVGAVFALNELFGRPFSRTELLPFVMEGERIACGSAHADNVAPALFGGFVLIRSYEPIDIVEIPTPPDLFCTLVHPHIEVRTEDARSILKKEIPLKLAITQWGNVGGLIAGLMKSDYELIGRSLTDVIVEPLRAILIPHFAEVKAAALTAGSLGASISGSGPSIFALSKSKKIATESGAAMQQIFKNAGMESDLFISPINSAGPRILN